VPAHEIPGLLDALRREMSHASAALEFERAAELRDRIRELEGERLRLEGTD
jgi:excinuclease UvrABC nuclease subunit